MKYIKTILLLLFVSYLGHGQIHNSDVYVAFGDDLYWLSDSEIATGVKVESDGEFGSALSLENKGTMLGSGIFNIGTSLINTGNISPGSTLPGSPLSVLTFQGPYSNGASGTLNIELGGIGPTDYDKINVLDNPFTSSLGTAALAGTLNVTFVSGFIPTAGNSFTILNSVGLVSGTFSTVNLPIVTGLCPQIIYNNNSVVIIYNAPIVADPGFGSAPYFVNTGVTVPDINGTATVTTSDDPLNQATLPYNTAMQLVLPFFNAHQTNSIPLIGVKINLNIGNKLIVNSLPSVSVSNPFSWVQTSDISGNTILVGTQMAVIDADYYTNIFFEVKGGFSCSSSIAAQISEQGNCLIDQEEGNNEAIAQSYTILFGVNTLVADATCFGGDGTATFTVSGGTAPYSYSSSPSLGVSFAANVMTAPKGTYMVTIEDANGCQTVVEVVIDEPAILAAMVANIDIVCFGANDGTITITSPTGGSGTYQYSINADAAIPTWQNSGSFTGLLPATYQVAIRDAVNTGCVIDLDAGGTVISELPIMTAMVANTDIVCFGANDGTITITSPTGGSGTYQYSINADVAIPTWQNSGSFTGLLPATYQVAIRDAVNTGCVIDLDAGGTVISELPIMTAMVANTDIVCFGANDGTITITSPTGGSGTYQYSINADAAIPTWQNSGSFTGLLPATYQVAIRDAVNTGCIIDLDAGGTVISELPIMTAMVANIDIVCFGANDGTITITSPTGGSGTYQYSINADAAIPTWQNSGSFTGLLPATYQVAIRDAVNTGCVIDLDGTGIGAGTEITQPTNVPDLRIDPIGLTGNVYDFPTPFVHDYVVKLTNLNPAPASPVVIQIPKMAGYVLTLVSTGPGIVIDPLNGPTSYDNTSWGAIDASNQFFYRITGPTISCGGMQSVGLRVTRVTPNLAVFPFNIRVRQATFEVVTGNNFTTIQIEGQ